jgi:membrane protein YdbS with pleckstrin-like domain
MKALLKLVTFCLMISVLISPVLVTWRIWQYHIEFINAQHLVMLDDRTTLDPAILSSIHYRFSPIDSVHQLFKLITSTVATPAFLGFIIAILLGFYSGILLNDRYRIHRHTIRKQQIATLEKIWQQSIY